MWRENTGFLFRKTTFLRCADSLEKISMGMEKNGGRDGEKGWKGEGGRGGCLS